VTTKARAFSKEEVSAIEERLKYVPSDNPRWYETKRLLATVRDCYKTIADKDAEIERLREALEYIATFEHVSLDSCDINVKELGEFARQALEGDE
jgi:hypothetical protein